MAVQGHQLLLHPMVHDLQTAYVLISRERGQQYMLAKGDISSFTCNNQYNRLLQIYHHITPAYHTSPSHQRKQVVVVGTTLTDHQEREQLSQGVGKLGKLLELVFCSLQYHCRRKNCHKINNICGEREDKSNVILLAHHKFLQTHTGTFLPASTRLVILTNLVRFLRLLTAVGC